MTKDRSSTGESIEMETRKGEVIDDKSPSRMSNKSPQKQAPPPSSGKGITFNVVLLDGENIDVTVDKNAVGRDLFEKVCTHLDLIEKDYFGLQYTDDRGPAHLKYWLNMEKKITKQKKRGAWVFEFALKFYPPDPCQLRESLTRWLVVLQVRRDILSGRLPCTFTTLALLGSYNVQADIGEYDPSEHGNSYDYIKDMAFAPNQTPEILEKIAELHRQHKGQTPDEAEKFFLDNAKKLSMYGVDLHKAKDQDNQPIMLGVCASGLLVYKEKLRIARFVWPKILKISYKRNQFYIKIRPGEMERNDGSVMFKLDNHRLAKRLWKTCVEHHAFFRLREAEKPNNNPVFPRFGSKFRYSGRTLFQTRQTAALLDRPDPYFERSQPNRNTFHDTGNRSRSVDELANRRSKEGYDGSYRPDRSSDMYKSLPDEKDSTLRKSQQPTALTQAGVAGPGSRDLEDDTLQRRPYDSDTADRRDRVPSQGDATLERDKGHDDSMGLDASGILAGGARPGETDKERRKREKEEDKKRKKEAEDKKKKEEEERKKAEKDKKKNKGKDDLDRSHTEDRRDKLGSEQATGKLQPGQPGYAGLDGDKLLLAGPHAGDESADDKGRGKDRTGRGSRAGDDDSDGEGRGGKRGSGYLDKDGDGRGSKRGSGYLDKDGDGRGSKRGSGYMDKDKPGDKDDHGKDKHRKGKDKDHDKDHKGKNKDKDHDGEEPGDKEKRGLFGKKKKGSKDKDSPARLSHNGDRDWPYGGTAGGYPGDQQGQKGKGGYPDEASRYGKSHPLGVGAPGVGYVPPGLGVGKGDMTGVVGDESYIDNKQRYIPIKPPVRETRDTLKRGEFSDNMMPFFHPAATSTTGRGKVPPPVPPKGHHGMDDSFNRDYKTEKDGVEETKVVKKVTLSGDEDDYDFDEALAEAIRSVTEFNPDMSVERIECVQQIEDSKGGK